MKNAKRLIDEAEKRQAEQSGRVAAYRRFSAAYFDQTPSHSAMSVDPAYNDGRPRLAALMDAYRSDATTRRGAPNIIKSAIRSIVAVRGQLPVITVLPEDIDDEEKALLRTRALRQQWRQSRMDQQHPRAAWFTSAMGDVCYTLTPRTPAEMDADKNPFKPAGVYIQVVNPGNAFPQFRFGEDADELANLYLVWRISKLQAKEQYGVDVPEDFTRLVMYMDDEVKQVVVGDKIVSQIEHDLGFVPAEWHSNEPTDGSAAQSDINNAVELQETVQQMWNVFIDAMTWATYPLTVVKDAENIAGDTLDYGPGAKVSVTGTGDVQFRAPEANADAAALILSRGLDSLMNQIGVSPVTIEGIIDRSNVSGRSVAQQMSPMEMRLQAGSARWASIYERLNSKIMLMLYRVPELNKATMTLWGEDEQGRFKTTFTGDDMAGWIENSVVWDAMMALNRHERVAMALQMHKEGLLSGRDVLKEYGAEDPDRALEEAMRYQQDKMKQAMQMQAAQQPPGPGGAPADQSPQPPGGASPGPGGPPGARGGMGGGPDGTGPPGPAQPPPGGDQGGAPFALPPFPTTAGSPASPGRGTAPPVPDVLAPIDQALAGVRLRGQIIERHPTPGGGVRVVVSDQRDVRAVKDALIAAGFPEGKIQVFVGLKPSSNGRTPARA